MGAAGQRAQLPGSFSIRAAAGIQGGAARSREGHTTSPAQTSTLTVSQTAGRLGRRCMRGTFLPLGRRSTGVAGATVGVPPVLLWTATAARLPSRT